MLTKKNIITAGSQSKRGFAAAAVFVFFGGGLGFKQKTSLTLRGATDLREEINPPQAQVIKFTYII